MTEPTANLRQCVAIAVADALGEGIHYKRPGFQRAADAAIAAYRQHPDGAAADRDAGRQDMRKCVFKAGAKP